MSRRNGGQQTVTRPIAPPRPSGPPAPPPAEVPGLECLGCSVPFDPIAARWRCPACGRKADCCDGAPLPPRRAPFAQGGDGPRRFADGVD